MPKISDKIKKLQSEKFTGRASELTEFKQILQSNSCELNILNYTGIGGVGKSSMLSMLSAECEKNNAIDCRIDAAQESSIANTIIRIGEQLGLNSIKGSYLNQLNRYKGIEKEVHQLRDINLTHLKLLSKGFGDLKVYKTKLVSGSGENTDFDTEAIIQQISAVVGANNAEFYLNPEAEVTRGLISDINGTSIDQRVIIMVDTYEKISSTLDQWLVSLVAEMEDRVIFVIAGRKNLTENWQQFNLVTKQYSLEPFGIDDTSRLLSLGNVSDANFAKQVQELTGGLPLGIKLYQKYMEEGSGHSLHITDKYSVVEEITKTLIRDVHPEIVNVLEQCAVLHWFNLDILECIVNVDNIVQIYDELRELPFVLTHSNGLKIHDRVQDFINDENKRHKPDVYKEMHSKAALFYELRINSDDLNIDINRATVELIYHKCRANLIDGINIALPYFNSSADLFLVEMCELIYEAVREIEGDNVSMWVDYFGGVTAKLKIDSTLAEQSLKRVLENSASHLDPRLRVYSCRWLAGTLWMSGKYEEVLAYADEAKILTSSLVKDGDQEMIHYAHRAIETTGLTLDRLGRFEDGLNSMRELKKNSIDESDQQGEGWALLSEGYFSWHSGAWDNAEKFLQECLTLSRKIGSAYMEVYPLGHLGHLYVGLGYCDESYLDKGRKFLEECQSKAIKANSLEMQCKVEQNYAQLELQLGNYEIACRHANSAVQLGTGMDHPYYVADSLRVWAETLIEMGDLPQARAKIDESYRISNELDANYLTCRVLVQQIRLDGLESKVFDTQYLSAREEILKLGFDNQLSLLEIYYAQYGSNLNTELRINKLLSGYWFALRYNRFWGDRILRLCEKVIDSYELQDLDREQFIRKLLTEWDSMRDKRKKMVTQEKKIRATGHINAGRTDLTSQLETFIGG